MKTKVKNVDYFQPKVMEGEQMKVGNDGVRGLIKSILIIASAPQIFKLGYI